ncbi:BglG family transcription antiterminator [Clostridium intestinale]|uniref:BglG family transcription antiterminator n=1 Tax=Clostridium intestinale TaxID=36845 RepID=UPI0028E3D6FD|nr:BglG family transcription antiterminator [Clostridium intestinale]
MRTKILLEILMKDKKIVPKAFLTKELNLSESSIRKLIRDSNDIGQKNGFQIELIKKEGYYLSITDEEKLNVYLDNESKAEGDIYNSNQRLKMLLFYIFQTKGYFTIDQLSERMEISRATVIRDLKKIEEIVHENGLFLEKKAHYGFRITGDERNYRRAFSEFVLDSDLYLEPTQEFYEFSNSFNLMDLRKLLSEELYEKELKISDVALENVLNHIKILVFRAKSNNYVSSSTLMEKKPDKVYDEVALTIAEWIKEIYSITLPESEISLLAVHISGKASAGNLEEKDKQKLLDEIGYILNQIDDEFLTNFCNDEELKSALLLHMFPLLNRMYHNLQLDNPLIDEVYSKYANIFVIAFRFGEHIEKTYGFKLTIDEVGYLALHFATHFERIKNKSLEQYKRIVVICTTGGGSAQLLRLKLETIFPKAIVVTSSVNELDRFKNEPPDLFLTTIPINEDFTTVPIIHIKQLLDDSEIKRIKEIVSLTIYKQPISNSVPDIVELFSEKFYYRNSTTDYEELLKMQSRNLIENGYAVEGFDESVLERERKFTTIYKNGIAGPHALKLEAIKDVVSVAVYDRSFEWQGRAVQIVFLINLQQGHLFLHREISRLLLLVMEDNRILERLVNAKDFDQFKIELERIIK